MPDEVEREVTEDDVEGQRMPNRVRSGRTDSDGGPSLDGEPKMSDAGDDVEGQRFTRPNRIT